MRGEWLIKFMINKKELEECLIKNKDVEFVSADGDGYHYTLTVVSDIFLGKTKLNRHQWVYAKLKHYIISGDLHAITLKTLTKQEWEKAHG